MAADDSDEALVHLTLAGDQEAFAALIRRHRRLALARAHAVLGDPADAADAAQEAFVQAYAQLATCRHPARFGAWLLTIVHRRSLNHARTIRRRRLVPLEKSLPHPDSDSLAERLDAEALRRRLLAALATLPPLQREIVLLADLEQLSHARIAELTGVTVLMSRRHLSDARRRLRQVLATAAD